MYRQYFGFSEPPFSIAPDPRYLYMSSQHREALAHLIYGIGSDGGFVMLTGEVGTGKTTVCRCLLEQVPPNTRIAFIINPRITAPELLASICDEFGIPYPPGNRSVKVFVDLINAYLLEARAGGSRAVLIIDEAQNLEPEVLEQLRLLTNLETSQEKLLRIILLGQPELRVMLSRPQLRQLNQRVTARYHLGPLGRDDVAAYVEHRLKVAGAGETLFPPAAVRKLGRLSGGVPRVINVLADRALTGAYVEGRRAVTPRILGRAAREVFGAQATGRGYGRLLPWVAAGVLAAGAALFFAPASLRDAPDPGRALTRERAGEPEPAVQPASGAASEATPGQSSLTRETLQWLFGQEGKEGEALALQALFGLWGAPYRPEGGVPAARQATDAGLALHASRGGLGDLRRVNLPAVLKLFDDSGRECWVTLAGLGEATASITAGSETRDIPLLWFGEYTLLWRPPAGYRGDVLPGDSGPLIAWLEEKLAARRGTDYVPRGAKVYDGELVAEVRRFQREEGLAVDGIAGPQTLMRLAAPGAEGTPRLARRED